MSALYSSFQPRLGSVLVATDFSAASKQAVLYATAIARRHCAKLFVAHVVSSRSESALMDGWRAGQAEMTELLIANRLQAVQNELVVKSGDVWPVLSQLISEKEINLVVVGTRGRTGLRKLILGSVAENIFRQAPCPVLTVGPNSVGQNPEVGPERILAATGFAAHSIFAVKYAIRLAQDLRCSLALLHVVTDGNHGSGEDRLAKLRSLIPADVDLPSAPLFFIEFGSAPERILETAASWNANLIVLGLHHVREASRGETTWGRAYEVISKATCPVLTVRRPE